MNINLNFRHRLPVLYGCVFMVGITLSPVHAATVNCQANRPNAANVLYL